MKAIKTGFKWFGIFLAGLIAYVILANSDDYVRAAAGLAIFIGFIAFEFHKRLVAIEQHLLALRAGSDCR